MGEYNTAAGNFSTIGGGTQNLAAGFGSTVPGGLGNHAYADYSFAAGSNAAADHIGSFLWSDYSFSDFHSSAINEFSVRASGGTRIYSNSALSAGVTLAAGASAWASVSDSTVKRNIRPVDGAEILAKLEKLPVSRWSYKSQDPSIEHIGPMAQDFYALFGIGESDTTISTIDPSGISLAAIKELARRNSELQSRVNKLTEQVGEAEALKAQVQSLQSMVEKLAGEVRKDGNDHAGLQITQHR
jgi:hypothetical protein